MAQSPAGEMHGFGLTLTSFVGRTEAVRDVAAMLADRRLVTVAGPGGRRRADLTRMALSEALV